MLMKKDWATQTVSNIKKGLSNENSSFDNVEQLFGSLGLSQELFETAYNQLTRNTHVVMIRQVNEVWINQLNKPLLKCWNANLDIQFVVDAYACVVYIISYISTAEKEMGLLLGNAQKEAERS